MLPVGGEETHRVLNGDIGRIGDRKEDLRGSDPVHPGECPKFY